MRTTFAIESSDSPAAGNTSEPVSIHDEPTARTAPRHDRQAARLRFRGPPPRNPVSNEPTKVEVE